MSLIAIPLRHTHLSRPFLWPQGWIYERIRRRCLARGPRGFKPLAFSPNQVTPA